MLQTQPAAKFNYCKPRRKYSRKHFLGAIGSLPKHLLGANGSLPKHLLGANGSLPKRATRSIYIEHAEHALQSIGFNFRYFKNGLQ